MADNQIQSPPFSDPLLNRFFLSPQDKASKDSGKKIVKAFYTQQTNNDSSLNFFKLRNARQIELLQWCKGSQKMAEFLDFMSVSDANKAIVPIDLTQTRIAAQFVGTLIESMAKNRTYPCVTAIDDGSVGEKEQRLLDALFRMHEAQRVNAAQTAAGMQFEPIDAFVPDDEMGAKVYYELEDRLPKEIKFEKMLLKVQNDIKFERILNRKTIFDLIVLNGAFTKIEKLGPLQYTVRKCIGTNMVYNFFMNDSGELEITQIGEFWNIKVKDFRAKFGQSPENPDGLTEKEIFKLASESTKKNIGTFNYMWNDSYMQTPFNYNRPYDDCNILVLDVEIDCGEDVYYVEKTDPFGRGDIQRKNDVPYQQRKKDGTIIDQPKPDNATIIKRQKNTWMRGVYAPYGDTMLYWGSPDIIINQYTNTAKPLSSYSVNIPNNDGEYIPSLFERGMEVLREYQITKLKRRQLIALIKPSGIRIDVESARNLDLGNGDTIEWLEVLRIYNQTGTELYSSKGVDPLQREGPALSNTVHDESIEKVIGLTNVMAGQVNELRQLWGVPQYRDGSDVGERSAAKLVDTQSENSFNVTDFITNANNQLWEETFYKLCLLYWNDVVKTEPESKSDMLNTRFDVRVKTKATDYEKERLEEDIQRYSQMPDAQGNPSVTLKDAIMLREIDDYKLACYYLSVTFDKNRRNAMDQSAKLQQQNQQLQQQSAQQANQQAAQLQQQKLQAESQQAEQSLRREKELALLSGIMTMADTCITKGVDVPIIWQPLMKEVISNVAMPLVQENQGMQAGMAQQQSDQQNQDAQIQQTAQGAPPQSQQDQQMQQPPNQ